MYQLSATSATILIAFESSLWVPTWLRASVRNLGLLTSLTRAWVPGLRFEPPGTPPHFFSLWFCKILILLMLRLIERWLPSQIIEPEGLTRKIFWNKELAGGFGPLLRAGLRKILDWLELRSESRGLWLQNIAK